MTKFDKRFGAAFDEEVLVAAYTKNSLDAYRKNQLHRKGKKMLINQRNLKI